MEREVGQFIEKLFGQREKPSQPPLPKAAPRPVIAAPRTVEESAQVIRMIQEHVGPRVTAKMGRPYHGEAKVFIDGLLLDALTLGMLCIHALTGLQKGKEGVQTFHVSCLHRTYTIETQSQPYGLSLSPADN